MNDWMDAEQRIERAQQLFESSQWEEALDEIDQALDINPSNGSWWSSKGFLLDHLERYEEAIEAYESALEQDPEDQELLSALGLDCVRGGQFLRAIQIFDRLQELDPNHEPAYCHRIMLYAELGEHDLAEEMFYSAQQIDENCPHCFWHLGNSMWMREDLERAIWCWRRALDLDPSYRGVRRRLAEAYRRQGDTALARDYYLAEYREDPANVELLLELGTMFLDNGQPEQAAAKFCQVLEFQPHHARALELTGDAQGLIGREEQALEAYRGAVEADDTLPGVHYKLAKGLMRLKLFAEAKQTLEAALSVEPADRDVLMAAGNCSLELGKPAEAQVCFERLIAVDDCLPGAYHNLAVCHFLQNNYEGGIRQCQLALELKDDYALARHKLVLANIHLRRWEDAEQLLSESLAVNPYDPALLELKRSWKGRRLRDWSRRFVDAFKGLLGGQRDCSFD